MTTRPTAFFLSVGESEHGTRWFTCAATVAAWAWLCRWRPFSPSRGLPLAGRRHAPLPEPMSYNPQGSRLPGPAARPDHAGRSPPLGPGPDLSLPGPITCRRSSAMKLPQPRRRSSPRSGAQGLQPKALPGLQERQVRSSVRFNAQHPAKPGRNLSARRSSTRWARPAARPALTGFWYKHPPNMNYGAPGCRPAICSAQTQAHRA